MPREKVGPVQGHVNYHNSQSESPLPSTIPIPLPSREMLLVILKWDINNISQVIMRTLLRVMSYILNLLFYIPIPPMVLTCTATQYPTTITSVLGISATNRLIPQMNVELMGGFRRTREGDESQHLR